MIDKWTASGSLIALTIAILLGLAIFPTDSRSDSETCDLALFYETCELGCPMGYGSDANGCPVCQCDVPPSELLGTCRLPICETKCEDYVLDAEGCVTCKCSTPNPTTFSMSALMDYFEGDACDFAEFNERCQLGCPLGYAHDRSGCPVCECMETPREILGECEMPRCPEKCNNYKVLPNGCAICNCAADRTDDGDDRFELFDSSGCNTEAFEESCNLGCPLGYEHNRDGCLECECQEVPEEMLGDCEFPQCDTKCKDYAVDANGCVTCDCATPTPF